MNRLSIALCFFLGAIGCGDPVTTTTQDMTPAGTDVDMMTPADTPDMTGVPAGPRCTMGMKCQTASGDGLCIGGQCQACAGAADDTKCQTVYGAKHLCIGGSCVIAECRNSTDCNGRECKSNRCAPKCVDDSDCPDSGTRCNTMSGACVADSCTAATGTQCANSADLCCSGTCKPVECCGTGACTPSGGGSGTCQSGVCVPSIGGTCAAPSGNNRFVDLGAATNGAGSKSCPYKTLSAALAAVKNQTCSATDPCVIIVKGNTPAPLTNARSIPANVNIVGADATLTACTDATCADENSWPIVDIDENHHGLEFTSAGDRLVKFIRLRGPKTTGGDTTFSGVWITGGATVTLTRFKSSGFHIGVEAKGGHVIFNQHINSHDNDYGLAVKEDAELDINLNAGVDKVLFSNNLINGIWVGSNAKFHMNVPDFPRLVEASDNGHSGVRFASSDTGPPVISGLRMSGNGKMGTGDNKATMLIYADSNLRLRQSYIGDGDGVGIRIIDNGNNSVAGLDFGNATTNGNNLFNNNPSANICVDMTSPPQNGVLEARGNTFDTNDCAGPSPMQLSNDPVCHNNPTAANCHCDVNVDIAQTFGSNWINIRTAGCGSLLP